MLTNIEMKSEPVWNFV